MWKSITKYYTKYKVLCKKFTPEQAKNQTDAEILLHERKRQMLSRLILKMYY